VTHPLDELNVLTTKFREHRISNCADGSGSLTNWAASDGAQVRKYWYPLLKVETSGGSMQSHTIRMEKSYITIIAVYQNSHDKTYHVVYILNISKKMVQ
jgi:hypothetical protein